MIPPALGTFGTMGRNLFRGPKFYNWDFSLVKDTRLTERVRVQFRAEFFNILNHPQFANPDTNFTSATFGVISSTAVNPRVTQLALKLLF